MFGKSQQFAFDRTCPGDLATTACSLPSTRKVIAHIRHADLTFTASSIHAMHSSQRILSSQNASTSAPSQPAGTSQRRARCSASQPEGGKQDQRQRRSHVRTDWVGTGCHLSRPPPQSASSKGNGSGPAVMQGLGSTLPRGQPADPGGRPGEPYDATEFVAETLLPTRSGKFRLRGYRHTVRGPIPTDVVMCRGEVAAGMQKAYKSAVLDLAWDGAMIVQMLTLRVASGSGPTLHNSLTFIASAVQFDGGRTYTEPCCIMTGRPENMAEVSLVSSISRRFTAYQSTYI